MDKIQLRFFGFASEVFQIAAPLVENPKLEDTVRELVMASSRMGAGFYRKNFWDFASNNTECDRKNSKDYKAFSPCIFYTEIGNISEATVCLFLF